MPAIWKPIPNLPPRFEASTDGYIQTLPYSKEYVGKDGATFYKNYSGRILMPRLKSRTRGGVKHPIVGIYLGTSRRDDRNREARVARLVLSAHAGIPFDVTNQREVQRWRIAFADGNVCNTRIENLSWVHSIGDSDGGQHRYEKNLAGYKASVGNHLARMSEYYADEEVSA